MTMTLLTALVSVTTSIVDLAKAHVIAMDRILNDKQKESVEVFNIGTGRGLSVLELLNKFEAATGVKVNYKIVGRRQEILLRYGLT